MNRKFWCLLMMLISVILLIPSACDSPEKPPASEPPPPSVLPSPVPAGGEIPAPVEGKSAFAFDLYHKLKGIDGNLFYSPYSISTALAMTYAGARSETAQQMADTLHFELAGEQLHASFKELDETLKERGKGIELYVVRPGEEEPSKEEVEGFRLNIVNALWGQKGYNFLPEYLDLVKRYYRGSLNTLDFANEPEPSRIEINKWASEQTEGRIEDLLPPGAIDPLTRLVLANAIYFNARWEEEFAERMTRDETFYLLDGSTVTAPMMHQEKQFSYAQDSGYQAVRLEYLGGEIAMVILLPREGKFVDFENSLDAQKFKDIIDKMESRQVDLSIPRFKFESNYRLDKTLAEMGMPDAFSLPPADFSGMTGRKDLYIGFAIHKTFVSVDEVGTEAAAVTAIGMAATAMPPQPVDFTADRPFIFLIQDIKTGTILFIGRLLNPAA